MPASPLAVRVILVDDNDMTRALLRGVLAGAGYDVVGEAGDGEQGVELGLQLKPDLVCLDIQMPKTDGLEVLKRLKAELPMTTVVMVTASTDRDTVQASIAAGAEGYIVKPFNSARVLEAVAAALAKRRGKPRPAG